MWVGFVAADFDKTGDRGPVNFKPMFGLEAVLDFGGGLAFVEPPGEDLGLVGDQTAFEGSQCFFLILGSWHGVSPSLHINVRNNA